MAKDNDMLLIAGLGLAAFFLLSKKGTPTGNVSNLTPYRPTNNTYGNGSYTTGGSSTGQIIQGAGSAIADIINAIRNKNGGGSNANNGGSSSNDNFDSDYPYRDSFWDDYDSGYYYA